MGNEKNDWMIYSDREMSVLSAQEEKVSFKELIKSLGMTQKDFLLVLLYYLCSLLSHVPFNNRYNYHKC